MRPIKTRLIPTISVKNNSIALNWFYLSFFTNTYYETQPAGIPSMRRICIFLHRFLLFFIYLFNFLFLLLNSWIFFYPSHPMLRVSGEVVRRAVLPKVTNVLFQLSYDLAMAKCSRECVKEANACISCTILEYLHILEDYGRDGECSVKRKNEYVTVMLDVTVWWIDALWHTHNMNHQHYALPFTSII